MTTLHLEHTVDDLDSWLKTFNSFADVRAEGGVTALQVRHDVDDRNRIAVDLEFESIDRARSFLDFLETKVWPNSPHFDGVPATRILERVDAGA